MTYEEEQQRKRTGNILRWKMIGLCIVILFLMLFVVGLVKCTGQDRHTFLIENSTLRQTFVLLENVYGIKTVTSRSRIDINQKITLYCYDLTIEDMCIVLHDRLGIAWRREDEYIVFSEPPDLLIPVYERLQSYRGKRVAESYTNQMPEESQNKSNE